MSEILDDELWLLYFTTITSDPVEWEEAIAQVCESTGLSREKVETITRALYDWFVERQTIN